MWGQGSQIHWFFFFFFSWFWSWPTVTSHHSQVGRSYWASITEVTNLLREKTFHKDGLKTKKLALFFPFLCKLQKKIGQGFRYARVGAGKSNTLVLLLLCLQKFSNLKHILTRMSPLCFLCNPKMLRGGAAMVGSLMVLGTTHWTAVGVSTVLQTRKLFPWFTWKLWQASLLNTRKSLRLNNMNVLTFQKTGVWGP